MVTRRGPPIRMRTIYRRSLGGGGPGDSGSGSVAASSGAARLSRVLTRSPPSLAIGRTGIILFQQIRWDARSSCSSRHPRPPLTGGRCSTPLRSSAPARGGTGALVFLRLRLAGPLVLRLDRAPVRGAGIAVPFHPVEGPAWDPLPRFKIVMLFRGFLLIVGNAPPPRSRSPLPVPSCAPPRAVAATLGSGAASGSASAAAAALRRLLRPWVGGWGLSVIGLGVVRGSEVGSSARLGSHRLFVGRPFGGGFGGPDRLPDRLACAGRASGTGGSRRWRCKALSAVSAG